jgi:hypothetical protein
LAPEVTLVPFRVSRCERQSRSPYGSRLPSCSGRWFQNCWCRRYCDRSRSAGSPTAHRAVVCWPFPPDPCDRFGLQGPSRAGSPTRGAQPRRAGQPLQAVRAVLVPFASTSKASRCSRGPSSPVVARAVARTLPIRSDSSLGVPKDRPSADISLARPLPLNPCGPSFG